MSINYPSIKNITIIVYKEVQGKAPHNLDSDAR
jgi:hypothetical protein